MDWKVHHTPYGNIDRDGWLKAMTQFCNPCDAYPINNQILFFDGHDIHFDDGALRQMKCKNIQPFVLKAGDSLNDQPNDNGPNAKLKSLYNVSKAVWMVKYGTKKVLPHHMNFALVEAWDTFKVSDGNNTRDSFLKKSYPPSSLTNLQQIPRHVLPPSKYHLVPRLKALIIYHTIQLGLLRYK